MRLSKIEIDGFKSFMSRLELDFSRGITAVIGPNGCGKTNIVDAIRWVLGEQKTRTLRNTKMENVIFNGTKLRKPLGMSEVHITLQNEDRSLPIDYNEITISRRLYRSGLSEYLINGEVTRLKTIRNLLCDTGLGNSSYSIIEREMIDSVLSDKEQDKKNLFEEAAGIMRYRNQREEALRKMALTETDITRLNDILGELDKEVRSLRYQRAKASRFVRLREQVDGMEAALLKHDLLSLLIECDGLKKEKAHHEEITLVDDSEISLRESKLQERRMHGTQLERKLQALHERRYDLSTALQRNDERIAINHERIQANRARIDENSEENQKAHARHEALFLEVAELRVNAGIMDQRLADIRAALEGSEQACGSSAHEFERARDQLKQRKEQALNIAEKRGLLEHLEKNLKDMEYRRTAIAEELAGIHAGAERLSNEVIRCRSSHEEARAGVAGSRESLSALARRKEKVGELVGACDEQYATASIERNRLKEKRELIESIRNKHAAGAAREAVRDHGFLGVLADLIHVKREHRKCFEACLSPVVESLIAGSKEGAFSSLRTMTSNGNGGFQILYPSSNHHSQLDLEGDGIIGDALSLIECEPGVKAHLASYLSGVVVVENVDTALSLLDERGIERVATLEGVFFDGPGRMLIAPSEDIEVTLLEHQAKIRELEQAERQAAAREEKIKHRKESLFASRKKLLEEEDLITVRLEGEKAVVERQADEYREAEIRLAKAEEHVANKMLAGQEALQAIEELRNRIARLSAHASAEERRGAQEGTELAELEEKTNALERRRDEAKDALAILKLEEATLSGELATVCSKIGNAEKLAVELDELIRLKKEDIERAHAQIALSEEEIRLLKDGTLGLHQEKEGVEKEIEDVRESCESIQEMCGRLEKELKEIKEKREAKREGLQQCTIALAAQETRIAALLERAQEKYGEDMGCYVQDRNLFDPSEWEHMDKDRFNRLKEQLDHYGPVNMLALEEYEQRRERFDFLMRQKQDLEEARESLLQAIRKINHEARKMLNDTFEQTRAYFKATFLSLFDGGEADLLFVDSDDPLEANIKIVANPKGKKLHDISSLSGGERALVALSLLFAIYLVKPSPFCVFDEVDAPLDDSNIRRFVNMLRSFTDRTQFIVITHNKKTMEAADCLYGVTMEEPGVSKMISVRLGDVDALKSRSAAEVIHTTRVEAQIPVHV